jgi:aminoglycoside 3-N-acetyltransferase I
MQIKVTRLCATEALTAQSLVKSFADRDVSAKYLEGFLKNPANYLLVGELDGQIAGYLLAHALQRLKQESHKMFIYEIDVASTYQRKGVGTALINHVREIVRREQMMNAFVFTSYSNKDAVQFYKRTGGIVENGDDLMFVYRP